jgi:hypothetical protein
VIEPVILAIEIFYHSGNIRIIPVDTSQPGKPPCKFLDIRILLCLRAGTDMHCAFVTGNAVILVEHSAAILGPGRQWQQQHDERQRNKQFSEYPVHGLRPRFDNCDTDKHPEADSRGGSAKMHPPAAHSYFDFDR